MVLTNGGYCAKCLTFLYKHLNSPKVDKNVHKLQPYHNSFLSSILELFSPDFIFFFAQTNN